MANGQKELDKVGCEYGRKIKQENNYQNEKLDKIADKQDEMLKRMEEFKEHQDKYSLFTRIGIDVIKYIIAAVVGALAAMFGIK